MQFTFYSLTTLGKTTKLHTHTHTFNGPFSRTTWVSRNQKSKTSLDFTEATDSEWQWHQLGHMQVCISLQTDNHASNPPLSFLQAVCPSCRPTNSVKALKAKDDQASRYLFYHGQKQLIIPLLGLLLLLRPVALDPLLIPHFTLAGPWVWAVTAKCRPIRLQSRAVPLYAPTINLPQKTHMLRHHLSSDFCSTTPLSKTFIADNPSRCHPIQTIGAPTSIIPLFLHRMPFLPQSSQFFLACDRQ